MRAEDIPTGLREAYLKRARLQPDDARELMTRIGKEKRISGAAKLDLEILGGTDGGYKTTARALPPPPEERYMARKDPPVRGNPYSKTNIHEILDYEREPLIVKGTTPNLNRYKKIKCSREQSVQTTLLIKKGPQHTK